MPKRREKVTHLGGRPAKHYGQSTMFCGPPALGKYQSGPYSSTKLVSHGNDLKLDIFSVFEVFSYYLCLYFILSMITLC
jgi:hypothetical protein